MRSFGGQMRSDVGQMEVRWRSDEVRWTVRWRVLIVFPFRVGIYSQGEKVTRCNKNT